MASWEHQLLSRIIRTGDMNTVLQWGIGYEDFLSSEGRAIFQHMLGYFQMPETSGAVLGPYALQQHYPNFHLYEDPSMTTEALCHEVRQNRLKTEGHELIVKANELLGVNPIAAVNMLSNGSSYLQSLGTTRKTDVFMDESMGRTMQRYELKEQGVDMSVCPLPWEPLQEATGGIEEEDYIVIYGRPKSMKTWVLAFLIAWCIDQGKRMLIYTKEMTADNIFQRVAAVLAGVRYHEFRRARLNPEEKAAIYTVWRYIHAIRQQQPIVCLSAKDAGSGGDTVPWLRSKIEQHKPDVCCVDGMYLMSSTSNNPRQKDNARVRDISRGLRQTVLDTRVPLIATIQANREAAKHADANLDEIAFSDAIGQDATLAMRVINEKHQPTLALVVGGSREYDLEGFRIYGLPAYNFGYAGPLTTAEVIAAQQADSPDSHPGGGRRRAAKTPAKQPDDVAQASQKFQSMNTED
jgi:hypothetical protein